MPCSAPTFDAPNMALIRWQFVQIRIVCSNESNIDYGRAEKSIARIDWEWLEHEPS